MTNGWEESAAAWIADLWEHGDFGRRYVLDPVMLPRALAARPATAPDVGCGEGRFRRMLRAHGVAAMGIDPARSLLAAARQQDRTRKYFEGEAASNRSGSGSAGG